MLASFGFLSNVSVFGLNCTSSDRLAAVGLEDLELRLAEISHDYSCGSGARCCSTIERMSRSARTRVVAARWRFPSRRSTSSTMRSIASGVQQRVGVDDVDGAVQLLDPNRHARPPARSSPAPIFRIESCHNPSCAISSDSIATSLPVPFIVGPDELHREPALERPDVVRDVMAVHEHDEAVLALHLPVAEVVEPVPSALGDARHAALEDDVRPGDPRREPVLGVVEPALVDARASSMSMLSPLHSEKPPSSTSPTSENAPLVTIDPKLDVSTIITRKLWLSGGSSRIPVRLWNGPTSAIQTSGPAMR